MAGAPDHHNIALGHAIKKLRKEAGLTQQELAVDAQVSVRELRAIERGSLEADWGTIRHLAVAMKMTLADVFRLTEELDTRMDSPRQ